MTEAQSIATKTGREVVISRVLDAPRELVFEAWTDPRHVGQWWGPHGFTNTIHEMDVRPGGVWRFIMHSPDGVDYVNKVVFIEIVKPERLVYHHGDEGVVGFHVTVTFAEHQGKTLLTMRSVFPTAEELENVCERVGVLEGGKQTLERLGQYVTQLALRVAQ